MAGKGSLMAKFIHTDDEDERRMSFAAYNYYTLTGHSPEDAVKLATESPDVPEMYETKAVLDHANSGEFTQVIGLKQEYKGDIEMNRESTSSQLAKVLKSKGYEHTKTTTGVHTWWFEGMAIAEDDSYAQSVYRADDWDIAQMHKRHEAAQAPELSETEALQARIAELEKQVEVAKKQAENDAAYMTSLEAKNIQLLKSINDALLLLVLPSSYMSEIEAKQILAVALKDKAQS